jgi:hypothetical protein
VKVPAPTPSSPLAVPADEVETVAHARFKLVHG